MSEDGAVSVLHVVQRICGIKNPAAKVFVFDTCRSVPESLKRHSLLHTAKGPASGSQEEDNDATTPGTMAEINSGVFSKNTWFVYSCGEGCESLPGFSDEEMVRATADRTSTLFPFWPRLTLPYS